MTFRCPTCQLVAESLPQTFVTLEKGIWEYVPLVR